MKKMQSFLMLTSLLSSSHTIKCMEQGSANNKPYAYSMVEALHKNPLFLKMKSQTAEFEADYDITLEEVIVLPMPQQQEFIQKIEQNEKYRAASEIMRSTIIPSTQTSASEDQEEMTELKELFQSIRLEAAKNTSGLSWGLWWQQKYYGNDVALQYAVDNNEFDINNTDHLALLSETSAQYCANNYVTSHKTLNASYKQQAEDLKAEHCYAMVAVFKKFQAQLSELDQEMNAIITEQKHQKEVLLQEHQQLYEKNNATFQKLQSFCSEKNIALKNTPKKLDVCPQLQKSLSTLDELQDRTAKVLKSINNFETIAGSLSAKFAIENNK